MHNTSTISSTFQFLSLDVALYPAYFRFTEGKENTYLIETSILKLEGGVIWIGN